MVSSISNYFTNKTFLANKWMSFSSSNLALVRVNGRQSCMYLKLFLVPNNRSVKGQGKVIFKPLNPTIGFTLQSNKTNGSYAPHAALVMVMSLESIPCTQSDEMIF